MTDHIEQEEESGIGVATKEHSQSHTGDGRGRVHFIPIDIYTCCMRQQACLLMIT